MKTKIYMIPGLMNDERLWIKLEKELQEYEIVHVPIPKSDSFDEICELIDFEDEQINLLGFSLGGFIASYYALKNPHKIKNLILVSASACDLSQEEHERRTKSLKVINELGFKNISKSKVKSLLDDEEDEEVISLVQDMYVDLGLETLNYQMNNVLKRIDLKEKLLNANFNKNFYFARNDRLVNYMWLLDFRNKSKESNFEIIEGKSHMLPLEKSYDLSQKIKKWIQG